MRRPVVAAVPIAAPAPRPELRPLSVALARLAPGAPVAHPHIHEADIRTVPAQRGAPSLLARTRARVQCHRVAGDPLPANLIGAAQAIQWHRVQQGSTAAVRLTLAQLARSIGCCVDTARRCVRWLERAELIDTVRVMARGVIDGVRRLVCAANLYLLPAAESVPADEPGPPVPLPSPTPAARAAQTLARWASAFRLAIRPAGWNRAPSLHSTA